MAQIFSWFTAPLCINSFLVSLLRNPKGCVCMPLKQLAAHRTYRPRADGRGKAAGDEATSGLSASSISFVPSDSLKTRAHPHLCLNMHTNTHILSGRHTSSQWSIDLDKRYISFAYMSPLYVTLVYWYGWVWTINTGWVKYFMAPFTPGIEMYFLWGWTANG